MKPLRIRLQEARKRLGVPWDVLERDYLLSWMLAGICRTEELRNTLIFKGGTALRKCYFGDYRFSEDLDFSAVGDAPRGSALEEAARRACKEAARLLDEYAPVEIICERFTEKEPHPGGQEAFTIRARFPWQKLPQTRVLIEISTDEKVLKPFDERPVIHEYEEPLDARLKVYALEEIIAEKLRAILQHVERLEARGWSRSRARDYYDIWRILGDFNNRLNLAGFSAFLREKCAVRNVFFKRPEDFFEAKMLDYVEKTWEQLLSPLVPNLPSFDVVMAELRPQLAAIVKT